MTQIKSFAQLGITAPSPNSFIGDSIPMKKILGKTIILHDFKIGPSNFKGERLDLQITYDDDKRVVWTSSTGLIETIKLIPKEVLPITTTIVQENERFKFT